MIPNDTNWVPRRGKGENFWMEKVRWLRGCRRRLSERGCWQKTLQAGIRDTWGWREGAWRLEGKVLRAGGHFLLGKAGGGGSGSSTLPADSLGVDLRFRRTNGSALGQGIWRVLCLNNPEV